MIEPTKYTQNASGSWWRTRPAGIFFALVATSLAGGFAERARLLEVVATYLLASHVAQWVLADARERGWVPPFDVGLYLFFGWPVLAPLYLFSTRGWRAFGPLGWFCAMYAGASLAVFVLYTFVR